MHNTDSLGSPIHGGMAENCKSPQQWRVQTGARGVRAIPSRLKKRWEKDVDVDLRPHTYVRTRGAKYRCQNQRSAHTVRGHAYVRVYVRTCGRRCSAHL